MIISIGLGQIVIDLERKIEFRSRGIIFANNSSHWLVKILNFLKKDKRIFTSSVKKKKKRNISQISWCQKSIQDRGFLIQDETSSWQEFLAWLARKEAASRAIL